MSYGLNIEMHKQVSGSWFLSVFTVMWMLSLSLFFNHLFSKWPILS